MIKSTTFFSFDNIYPQKNRGLLGRFRSRKSADPRLLVEKLLAFCKHHGVHIRTLIRPEIFKHSESFSFLSGFKEKSVHFILKKPRNIRVLKHSYNIGIFPWNLSLYDEDPVTKFGFFNTLFMLSLLDEIWVGHEKDVATLEKAGFTNVFCMPAFRSPCQLESLLQHFDRLNLL